MPWWMWALGIVAVLCIGGAVLLWCMLVVAARGMSEEDVRRQEWEGL